MTRTRIVIALAVLALGLVAAKSAGTGGSARGRLRATSDAERKALYATSRSAMTVARGSAEQAPAGVCGDSILDAGEGCDDGNTSPGDGCSSSCQVEPGWTCTAPIPPRSGTNLVADPSFEAGTPNPSWTESSTNFGTPLCTVTECGDDGGTGPSSGSWWAWFGGVPDGVFEEGSLTQSVVIASTATTLEFELEQIACDSASDFLEVKIDGSTQFLSDGDSPLCGVLGYATQSINITGFANDAPHTLEFFSRTFSENNDVTDFFVDDVVLSDNVPVPAVPSQCAELGPLGCNVAAFDFNAPPHIPDEWTVIDNEGSGLQWTDIATAGATGNYTGGTGDAPTASSLHFGAAEFDTELRTSAFDLSALRPGGAATISYLANYQNFQNRDFLDLDISTDGGTNWVTLLRWNEDHGLFLQASGEAVSVDLAPYVGLGGLILRWRYYDPNVGDDDWYAQIDDVALSCPPRIGVAPGSLSSSQPPDTQEVDTLTVSNVGGGELAWSISEAPADCATLSDVSWLSASPGSGMNAIATDTAVTVTFDSTGLALATYQALLCIDSNDTTTPQVEVPVTLEVAFCTPAECDDGNPCTDDVCNPSSGCVNTPNADPCDDGDACTTNDACVGGSCVSGAPLNCDDGLFCTGVESCDPALGCQAGTPPNCDDGDSCTSDSCNEGTDSCDHVGTVPDELVLADTTLTSGEFVALSLITAGPELVIDGAVKFVTGQEILFVDRVDIAEGFTAEVSTNLCP